MEFIRKKNILVIGVICMTLPSFAFAQANFSSIVARFLDFLDQLGLVLIGLGGLVLAYGIFRYLLAGGDPVRRAEGGKVILWGIITLAVMVSFWGLVNLLLFSFFDVGATTQFELHERLFDSS